MAARTIGPAIDLIREKTTQGTINLNTNGSLPDRRKRLEQGQTRMDTAFVACIVDQRLAVGQQMVQRNEVAVLGKVRVEGRMKLRCRHVARRVQALARLQVIAGRFVSAATEESQFSVAQGELALQADPTGDGGRNRAGRIVAPCDLAGDGGQG